MLKGSFQNTTPFTRVMLTACLMIICFLLMMFVASMGAIMFFGVNIFTQPEVLNTDIANPHINLMKFFQVMYSMGLFIFPPLLVAYLVSQRPWKHLMLDQGASYQKFIGAALLILSAIPLINLMADFNAHLRLPQFLAGVEEWMRDSEEKAKIITTKFLNMKSPGDLIINLGVIALIPAIGEELLFRGLLQGTFTRWTGSKHWGIIVTAVLFSALHLQFFGFLPRMMMGILFGYLLLWTQSLWIPITAHFINNSLAVLTFFLMSKGTVSKDIENIGSTGSSLYLSLLSLIITTYLLILFFRSRKRRL